ncbi:MAG: hypothetical protein H6Q33_3015 [Deltaproteobacteria bacterium]|nr:hypothetical protein [Deltaproteobacteria bacterium]
MKPSALLLCVCGLVATMGVACGTSGSEPTSYPEVRFRVRPNGTAKFTAELRTNGILHGFPTGTTFTASSNFDFYLEGAAPPYGGTFTLAPDSPGGLDVVLTVTGESEQTATADAARPRAIVGSTAAAAPPRQEVRFHVCLPLSDFSTCFGSNDPGVFGVTFNGSVGDPFNTYLLFGTTPSIYYLEDARDTVNGVFAIQPSTGQTLVAQLFINGNLIQTESGTHDVLLKESL